MPPLLFRFGFLLIRLCEYYYLSGAPAAIQRVAGLSSKRDWKTGCLWFYNNICDSVSSVASFTCYGKVHSRIAGFRVKYAYTEGVYALGKAFWNRCRGINCGYTGSHVRISALTVVFPTIPPFMSAKENSKGQS